jgi:SIR2-like domain
MQYIANGPNIPNALVDAHEEGRVVFFCGAGISYPAGLPLFKGLVDEIYNKLGTSQNDSEAEAEAYTNKQYDTTLNLLEARYPNGRIRVREALAQSLIPDLTKEGATTTHAALLDLARSRDRSVHLVTTNFDRIFNHLISEQKLPIKEYEAPCLPIPKNSRWNGLVYLHGLLPKEPEKNALNQLVLTSGDFGLAYLVERWAARFVSDLFQNFTVCFVGYGINDPVLRYLMDALAADRMLGEIAPQAYAFGSCKPGQEDAQKVEWEAKGVIPILYEAPQNNHSLLHDTLRLWAETYRDGIQGKEHLVVKYAQTRPSASTQQDDYVGRMIWALSGISDLPAKCFAELEPVPPLEWLEVFSKEHFSQNDLSRFGISSTQKPDEKLKFSLLCRPASYQQTPRMSLTFNGMGGCDWDGTMFYLASWLLRHLNDPKLLLWIVQNGGQMQNQLVQIIESKLDEFAKLGKEGNTVELDRIRASSPNSIPCPPMRVLWNLMLTGRVKTSQDNLSFYHWNKKLKRDGLTITLRFEFRELLAPKIKLKKPIQFSLDQDDSAEITLTSIRKFVDWDLALASDHVYYTISDLEKLENWPNILTELFVDIQQLLHDALDLQKELGVSDNLEDRSYWHLPSISPHWQNRRFNDWVSLIELLRDAWLFLLQSNPAQATKIAQYWFELPYPTFKRLALFAATKDKNISPDEWVKWLFTDDYWWLWTSATLRETMRLLVLQGQNLTSVAQEQLETAILTGPPREMFRESLDHEEWKDLQERGIWKRLAKLDSGGCILGDNAAKKLEELSAANPTWQLSPHEKDEFCSWMSGTGDPDYEDRHQQKNAPQKLENLMNWLQTDPIEGHRSDYREDLYQRNFTRTMRALFKLSEQNIWPLNHWKNILMELMTSNRVQHYWFYFAPLIAKIPNQEMFNLNQEVTWLLRAISKQLNCHQVIFFEICHNCLNMEYQNEVIKDRTDPLSAAINHPIGRITQALLDMCFFKEINDDDGLPDEIKSILTILFEADKAQYIHGKVILTSRLVSLFRVDPEWTKQYLLPILSWERPELETKAAWMGFLWSPQIYLPLLTAFKNDLLETARHYDILDNLKTQYVSFITYIVIDPSNIFTIQEFQSAISNLPAEGLRYSVQALENSLVGTGEQREQFWNNRIQPYWQNFWPKSKEFMSRPMAEQLVNLSIAAGNEFPTALRTVFDWLLPIQYPYEILHLLDEEKLCSKFPQDVLSLLDKIIEEKSYDLGKLLDAIADAWPEAKDDPRYRKLLQWR